MPHAIRVHQFGGPEVLRWEEVTVRPPSPASTAATIRSSTDAKTLSQR